MKTTIILLFLLSIVLAVTHAAENVINLQDEQVSLRCPASWVIIAHKLSSPSDVVAFQIHNPADDGSDDSTNLSVVVWDLRQTEAMLKFTQAILEHEKQKHSVKEVGEWVVNTWNDKQGGTPYEIQDCYRTAKPFGIHVRLATPKLPKTTKDWSDKLEADIKKLLESITVKTSK